MSDAEDRRKQFSTKFNTLMTGSGKTNTFTSDAKIAAMHPSAESSFATSLDMMKIKKQAKTKVVTGSSSGGGSKKPTALKVTAEQAAAFDAARAKEVGAVTQDEKPFWEKGLDLAMKPVELMMRPYSAVFEAGVRGADAITGALSNNFVSKADFAAGKRPQGLDFGTAVDVAKAAGSGIGAGLSGAKTTGGGNFVQALKRLDTKTQLPGPVDDVAKFVLSTGLSGPIQDSNYLQSAEKKYMPNGIPTGWIKNLDDPLHNALKSIDKALPTAVKPFTNSILAPFKALDIPLHNLGKKPKISPTAWYDRALGAEADVALFEVNAGGALAQKLAPKLAPSMERVLLEATASRTAKAAEAESLAFTADQAAIAARAAGVSDAVHITERDRQLIIKAQEETAATAYTDALATRRAEKQAGKGSELHGKDAVKESVSTAIDNATAAQTFMDTIHDPEALKTLNRQRLVQFFNDPSLNNGTMSAEHFMREFEKLSPKSPAVKAWKAGKQTADDAAKHISVYAPQLEAPWVTRLKELSRAHKITDEQMMAEFAKGSPTTKIAIDFTSGAKNAEESAQALLSTTYGADYWETVRRAGTNREVIRADVQNQVDKFMYEIGNRGTLLPNSMATLPGTGGALIAENIKNAKLSKMYELIDRFNNKRLYGSVSEATRDAMKAEDPYFAMWHDSYMAHRAEASANFPGNVVKFQEAEDLALLDVVASMDTEMREIQHIAEESLKNSILKIPGFKVFDKTMLEFPKLGIAAKEIGDKILASQIGSTFHTAFNYSARFPGYSSLLAGKEKSLGVEGFENFKEELLNVTKGTTHQERMAVRDMRRLGARPFAPGKEQELYDFLQKGYDNIRFEEVSAGLQDLNAVIPGYENTHIYRKRSWADINAYKTARGKAILKNKSMVGHYSEDIAKMGHKVEHDPFANLLWAKAESQQRLTKQYFKQDLVTHYGVDAVALSMDEQVARHLVPVSKRDYEFATGKPYPTGGVRSGEYTYLDKDINRILTNYDILMKANSSEARDAVALFDWVTRKFKTLNTIYFPGYHVRNIIGDMFMGILDGVKMADYKEILNKISTKETAKLSLGGGEINFMRLWDDYSKNLASSGFFDSDMSTMYQKFTRGDIGKNQFKQESHIRKFAEKREDLGRFVHFYAAMKDEMARFRGKGLDFEAAYEQAMITSMSRVNKFKFDYGALTKQESTYIRRGIPFYTYMRKAVPVLFESILTNPKYLLRVNRLETSFQDRVDPTSFTQFTREMGYGKLAVDWMMGTSGTNPVDTLQNPLSNPVKEIVTRLHPLVQIPIELQTGNDLYTGKPLTGNNWMERIPNAIENKWRIFKTADFLSSDVKTTPEKIGKFLGIDIKHLTPTDAKQVTGANVAKVDAYLKRITDKLATKGYSVYASRGNQYSLRIKDQKTGKVIFEGQTLKEIQDFVNTL